MDKQVPLRSLRLCGEKSASAETQRAQRKTVALIYDVMSR